MRITTPHPDDHSAARQMAAILVDAFRQNWPDAWPDLDSALGEVREAFGSDRLCRVAVGEDGDVLGWIGGIRAYYGHVWELHPLAVRPDQQGRGIGRALVLDFEDQVRQRGAITIMLGTDDENNMTSLAGVDLYPDVTRHIATIKNLRRHPYEFYQKLGYVIVGVLPDANGPGKPDIFMAKRVSPVETFATT